MRRRPPISTRTDTLFPTRRSSDLSAGSGSRSAHPAAYSHDPAGVAHGGRAGTLRPDRPDDPGHGRNPRGDLGTNRSSTGCHAGPGPPAARGAACGSDPAQNVRASVWARVSHDVAHTVVGVAVKKKNAK